MPEGQGRLGMNDHVDLSIRQFTRPGASCAQARRATRRQPPTESSTSSAAVPSLLQRRLTERGLSSDALKSRGKRACAWASSMGVPWLFIVTHEALEPGTDAASVLDGCGLGPMMPMTGMLAPQVAYRQCPGWSGAHRPGGRWRVFGHSRCQRPGLWHGSRSLEDLIGTRSFWTDHFPVLGLTGGKSACSAAVLMVDGYGYVALVATDPGQQRRGYADAP